MIHPDHLVHNHLCPDQPEEYLKTVFFSMSKIKTVHILTLGASNMLATQPSLIISLPVLVGDLHTKSLKFPLPAK